MGLALTGGGLGGVAAGTLGAEAGTAASALGSFLGSTRCYQSCIYPVSFGDRQVAEMRAQGVQNPEEHIDWGKAAGLGALASGLQALPVESILMGGPLLNTLTKWGAKSGTSTSARMLASIADVAGTNALAGSGTQFLSRLNADMPLLDDGAKSEYLDAAIAGTLVGIPFGLYRGIKGHPHPKDVKDDEPIEKVLERHTEKEEVDNTVVADKDEPQPLPRSAFIHDPKESYGIANAEEAAEYLNNINYSAPDGTKRNGFEDFVRKHGSSYSDAELLDAARRVKRVRELTSNVKGRNGILYNTIEELPQSHSNDPKILTKAAALTDQFGYDDAHVRGMSDSLINKLHELNVKKELSKSQQAIPQPLLEKVLDQLRNQVDEQVQKDVQEYGSLYSRPQVKERQGLSSAERREALSKNPRAELARLLMQTRKEKAGEKAYEAFLGSEGEAPIRLPDLTKPPKYLEEPPSDGEAFSDYAGLRQEPMGPRALLEYKPFDNFPTEKVVDALDKGANKVGPKVSDKLSKAEYAEFLMNSPLVKAILGKDKTLAEIKEAIARGRLEQNKKAKREQKEQQPRVLPDGSFSRSKNLPKEKPFVELPLDKSR